jgi:phosphinothricin acetyltransferase
MKMMFRSLGLAGGDSTMTRAMTIACIRLATGEDAEGVHAIYAPVVRETVISFEFEPPTVEEMRRRITTTLESHPWLVCDVGGLVAGYAYASAHRERAAYQWAADVSVYNHPGYHRQGVGRALYTALFAILRGQGIRQACAGITLPNEASVGLHEAMGFVPVGMYHHIGYKFGGWHSVGWWQAAIGDGTGEPGAAVALAELPAAAVAEACHLGTVRLLS